MDERGGVRYTVDANTLRDKVFGQSTGEADNGTFGCSVIDHRPCTAEGHNGSGVDDSVRTG